MAVNVVLPLSTCDIHLVRTGTASANTFQMVVVADNTANNISNDPRTRVVAFNPAIATAAKVGGANPHILFTGVADGETIGKVVHLDTTVTPNVSFEFLVRVRVHQSLSSFWIGNNQITIHQGMDNYVISVYASFSDGTRGDISGHPYVTFSSNAAAATVDAGGRVTGVSTNPATISVKVDGATTQTISVRVVGPVTTNRPIVKRIHGSGLFSDRRNILLLGDGFSNVTDFEKVATEIKDRMMNTGSHSPYNALRDSFNIWTACEPQDHPTPEDGITFAIDVRIPTTTGVTQVPVGNPVPTAGENPIGPFSPGKFDLQQLVSLVGLPTSWLPSPPTTLAQALTTFDTLRNFDGTTKTFTAVHAAALDQPTLDAWLELRNHGPLQARNSKLGVVHGGRLGERRAVPAVLPHKNLFYLPDVAQRSLGIDNRRRNSAFSFIPFMDGYLKSLKLAGAAATDPNFDIGNTWVGGGSDSGLGCLIVNDGYLGGSRFGSVGGPINLFATTAGVRTQLSVPTPTPATSTVLNHTPPAVAGVPFDVITAVLSHELAHALNLLDEYEGADAPHHSTVNNATPQEVQDLRASSNVTPEIDVFSAVRPKGIDPGRAKWDLDRIALASPLAAQASGNNTDTLNVQLAPKQGSRWQNAMTQQLQVFLRHPDLTRDPTDPASKPLGPLTIAQTSNLAGDTLTLKLASGTTSAAFPARSTLYLPRRDKNNAIQRVIHPSVISHIIANGPFAPQAAATCGQFTFAAENPPATIANFTLPAVAANTVGLYEGGGTWTCLVFRPCGNCRMRNFDPTGQQQIQFCFVCQYMLVNLIDPSVHDVIDALYP